MWTVLFWATAGALALTYFGYPLLVAIAAALLHRGIRRAPVAPTISVLVAAYDEEAVIEARLDNLLASDYPADRLEVIVASDGSTDGTVEAAASLEGPIRVLDLPRGGKAATLAAAARAATGEVLVFTDANTVFRPDALRRLAMCFGDPDVGGVAGHTRYLTGDTDESAGLGEALYWRYDTWLKALESRTGSVVSAHGGMYAVRRSLFRPVEDPAVTDDFAISTAVVAQGQRLVFEPRAIGFERPAGRSDSEFRRRVRLMTRGLRGVVLRRALLNPFRHGFYSVAFAARKVVRRLLPLTFPLLLVSLAALSHASAFFSVLSGGALFFLGLAAVGWLLRDAPEGREPLLYVPFYFCLANAASLVALWKVLRGERIERWTPQRHDALDGSTSPAG